MHSFGKHTAESDLIDRNVACMQVGVNNDESTMWSLSNVALQKVKIDTCTCICCTESVSTGMRRKANGSLDLLKKKNLQCGCRISQSSHPICIITKTAIDLKLVPVIVGQGVCLSLSVLVQPS